MKSILQTFVFLLLLTGASSLWGQCSIPPTVTGTSCNSKSTDSPSDDAIQFNLNVTSTNGSVNGFWIDVSGGTIASPQQGNYGTAFAVILGSGTAGSGSSYTVTLTDKANLSCRRTFIVGPVASCSDGCSTDITFICDDGSTSATLTPIAGITNVLWFNGANQQVGAGSLQVTINTPGMFDGMEEFYYTATDGLGCLISLCCPIRVATEDCGWLDLALTKTKSNNTPAKPGETVTFNIQVCNQGTDPATSVTLIDYVPSGFTFLANNGWASSGANATRTIIPGSGLPTGGLLPNGCVTIPLELVLNSNATPSNILNIAEITAGTDTRSRTTDIDSTPDSNPNNDAGGAINTPSDNALNGDGTGIPGSSNQLTDEDDADPATVRLVDLALRKEIVTAGPYTYGQAINFLITVQNQGNETATSINISDYVPDGYAFAINNGWTGSSPLISRTIAGPLAPGASTTLNLTLTLRASQMPNAWLNFAEISAFNDLNGLPIGQFDIDSTPDSDPSNDAGGQPNSPADNFLDGKGGGVVGGGTAATDEDDHDPALVNVFDLALTKTLNTAAPYTYGQTHSFTVTVFNQGNVAATNVVVSDYIPAGYSFVANNGWTGAAPTITNTIVGPIAPGASATLTLNLTFNQVVTTSAKSWINYSEITSAQDGTGNPVTDADSTPGSNGTNENAVLPNGPGDNDIASTTDSGVGSQDDHDPAGPKVFDLALRKTKLSALPSFSYGQNVMYRIELFNQGNIAATNIDVTDYLPCGLQFVPGSPVNSNWIQSGNTVKTTFTGILQPGQTAELFLDLRAVACYTNQNTAWTNYAEISRADDTDPNTPGLPVDIDSTPDANNGNDNGGVPDFGGVTSGTDDTINNENGDEDDHDPVKIEIFDLALRKVLATNAPYSYGQPLTFNVEVFNQGNVTATNVIVSDYIPAGYTFTANNGWTGGPSVITRTVAGPLQPGASTGALPLVLTLQMGSTATAWDNYAEVTAAQDDRGNNRNDDADSVADSNPNNDNPVKPGDPDDDNIIGGGPNANQDQDDHDPAAPRIIDIALRKTTVTAGPYTYGQVVSFQINVINQGNVVLTDIDVVDYIPCGFDYVSGSQAWTVGGAQATTMLSGTLMPSQVRTLIINLRVKPCYTPNAWLNYAEVKAFEDVNGNDISNQDIDSTPDTNKDNDAGGLAESPNDDFVNGDGKNGGGSPLDGNTASDEDDQDPELIRVFDLALRKQLVTAAPYVNGQPITFNITVFNQGNEPAYNVVLNDYVPIGYTFNAGLNPGWSNTLPTLTYTIPGPLAPGASTTVSIVLNINTTMGGAKNWINYAEIGSADNDTNPENTPPTDADGTPNSNTTNEDAILPNGPGDGDIDSVSDSGVGSQDDHDPAGPRLYDMALRKTTTAVGPFFVGNVVKFDIEVFNQGNFPIRNTRVADYIPTGFEYVGAQNFPTWTFDPISGNAVTIIPTTIQPGQSAIVSIYLRVKFTTNYATGWDNKAEIFRFEDTSGNDVSSMDIDSRPDSNPNNDSGGEPEGPSDDIVNGDGTGPVGTGPAVNDEDDQDPERIEIFDLALRKTLVTAGPYKYGQLLEFDVTVFNQGNEPATNVEITDYIPAGYGFSALNNTGWSGASPTVNYTIAGPIAVNGSQTVKIFLTVLQTTGGEKNWINYSEITSAADADGNDRTNWDIDSNPGSNNLVENAVEPGDVADNNINSNNKGGEEDDHDPAGIEIFDLAQRKTTVAAGPFRYGDVVKFTYEVFNQGSVQASSVKVKDFIPCGLRYLNASNNTLGWAFDAVSGDAVITLPGAIVPGASVTVDIFLQVIPCIANSNTAWTNIGEITSANSDDPDSPPTDIDSTPDNDPDNDPGGEPDSPNDDEITGDPNNPNNPDAPQDEDDHDPQRIEVVDLALNKKLITAGPYKYGQIIDFNIEVFNQGNVTLNNIEVVDYLSEGFDYDPSINPGWSGTAPQIYTIIAGPLAPEASTIVTVRLKLVQTNGGGKIYTNGAEISGMDDNDGDPRDNDDADSTPDDNPDNDNPVTPGDPNDDEITESPNDPNTPGDDDEDDSDPAGPKIFDLALRKVQLTAGASFSYGQTVMYGIQVYNQGNVDARDIRIVDTLPCGLEFLPTSAVNIAAGWVYNPATREVRATYSNILVAGTNTQLSLDVKVVACYSNVNNAWTNYAEIEGANDNDPNTPNPPVDIDSTPDGNNTNDPGGEPNTPTDDEINGDPNNPNNPDAPQDEDDQDPHKIQIFDLALRKTVDNRGPYMLGQTATFRISLFNQGNVAARNILVKDYLRTGFVFNAGVNPGWSLVGSNLEYTYAPTLLPGDSITLPLLLEITVDATPNVRDWWNYAEIAGAQDLNNNNRNDDADSTPNSNTPYENQVEPDGPFDNVINGNGPNFNQDEDDHDPEKVIVVGGLGDTVFKDLDGDGIQDPGEPGVGNVVATLTDCNGNVLATQTTDANGFYFFNNLIPGDYQVQFDISRLPLGCAFTFQNQGGDDTKDSDVNLDGLGPCTNIGGGEFDSTYDAGLLILAAIGDFVWHDLNGDGVQGAGEPGIPGVQVNLYKGDGTFVGTRFTDANGKYLFDFLYPGNYFLEFIDPIGFDRTFQNIGDDARDSDIDLSNGPRTTATTYLAPGERDLTWDAGYYICIPIGELVWYDTNKNDLKDSNENGINGLTVNLWRNHFGVWTIWDVTLVKNKPNTASDDGYWKFCAPPGQYYVEVVMPPFGLVRARANVGNNELIDSDLTNQNGVSTTDRFTVISGQTKCDIGAGFYPMATAGNLVWMDANMNGVQEANEPRMQGVKVAAISIESGEKVSEAVTDIDGIYNLEYLRKEDYYLQFTPPAGYSVTLPRATSDDMDSDVDHTYGLNTTRMFSMQPAMTNENIDMGVALGVLPVTWLDVNAKRVNSTHQITWRTSTEVNTSHYVVERRLEGQADFAEIPGQIKAAGNSSAVRDYVHFDTDVEKSGMYQYRVKQVDFDGKYAYSRIVKVSHNGENSIDLYPNPAKTTTNIQVVLSNESEVSMVMYDNAGRLVKVIASAQVVKAGDNQYSVDLSTVPAGVYNVVVTIDGVATQKKLIRIE